MAREVTSDGNRTELRSGFALRNYVTSLSELEFWNCRFDYRVNFLFLLNFQVKCICICDVDGTEKRGGPMPT